MHPSTKKIHCDPVDKVTSGWRDGGVKDEVAQRGVIVKQLVALGTAGHCTHWAASVSSSFSSTVSED